jgi:para-aminobenzoate synthetase component 1
MFQRLAAKWAHEQRADEALLLNPQLQVSETNSANLLCRIDGRFVRPLSEHALPGTMEHAVCEVLESWGMPVERRPITVAELKCADCVMVTNALIGAVPVMSIDDTPVQYDRALCQRINNVLFE